MTQEYKAPDKYFPDMKLSDFAMKIDGIIRINFRDEGINGQPEEVTDN